MRDDPVVVALVTRAATGDQEAWNEIVERYAPLVWSICQRYPLDRPDVDDVGQSVWLLLVENVGGLRQPAALPGWIATTTHHECLRVLRAVQRHDHAALPALDQLPPDPDAVMVEDQVVAAERDARLRAALAQLPRSCRKLLSLLMQDPRLNYQEISATLGMAVGSIGPLRARCLSRLRESPHVMAIADRRIAERETGKE